MLVVIAAFTKVQFNPSSGLKVAPELAAPIHELTRIKPTLILGYGPPYALQEFSKAEGLVCCYDDTRPIVEASADLCAGQIRATGTLPVQFKL